MKARIHDFAFSRGGDNLLTIATPDDCRSLYDKYKDCEIEITIKKYHPKRSLDANAYAWVLMDKLASSTGVPKEDVYKQAIRGVGGNTEAYCGLPEAVAKLRDVWGSKGLGYQSEVFPSKIEGCINVILYYGSSTFDSAQMARFIDNIIQDCKAVGVETLPPDKLDALLKDWR